MIDIKNLAKPQLIDTSSFEQILSQIKDDLIATDNDYSEVVNLQSEPIVKILEVLAYRELLIRNEINNKALSTMLAYADGNDLDNVVAKNNITRLKGEDDDKLKERYLLSFEALSNAGTKQAYEFHALSSDPRVINVSVNSPCPGQVDIYILSNESDADDSINYLPSDDLISVAQEYLNTDKIRAITDLVEVKRPSALSYSINARLYLPNIPASEIIYNNAMSNINKLTLDQIKLNNSISLSSIYKALHIDNVNRVELIEPADDISVNVNEFAVCTNVTIEVINA